MMNDRLSRSLAILSVVFLLAPDVASARYPLGDFPTIDADIHQVRRGNGGPRVIPRPMPVPRQTIIPNQPYRGPGYGQGNQPYGPRTGNTGPTQPRAPVVRPSPPPRSPASTIGNTGRPGSPALSTPDRRRIPAAVSTPSARGTLLSSGSRTAITQGMRAPGQGASNRMGSALVNPVVPQSGMTRTPAFRRIATAGMVGTALVATSAGASVGKPSGGVQVRVPATPTSKVGETTPGRYRLLATGDNIHLGQSRFMGAIKPQANIQGGTMGLRQLRDAQSQASVARTVKALNAQVASYRSNSGTAPANDGANSWMKFDPISRKFISPAGLRYPLLKVAGYDKDGMPHVLRHTAPRDKDNHTIFLAKAHEIPLLLDEAWKRPKMQREDKQAYVVDMGRPVGTKGETHVKIVITKGGTKEGTNDVLTAYPCDHSEDGGCWNRGK